jgi:hypothetical protein
MTPAGRRLLTAALFTLCLLDARPGILWAQPSAERAAGERSGRRARAIEEARAATASCTTPEQSRADAQS